MPTPKPKGKLMDKKPTKLRSLSKFQAFNLGKGSGNTVLEVLNAFEQASGKKVSLSEA